MKPTPAEIEQDALIKNFLDGLEPLQAEKTRLALRGVSSLQTLDDQYLESIPSPAYNDMIEIDTEVDLICEELSIGPGLARRVKEYKDKAVAEAVNWEVAQILSVVLSEFTRPCKNLRASVFGLIFAAGLDEANSLHSQAEIARQIGCTRALISHYTIRWAEKIRLGVFKFRKAERTRAVFAEAQKESWAKRKEK